MVQLFTESWVKFWTRWEIRVLKAWNEWEIRALVLISLTLQLLLIAFGKQRKHDRRRRIRYTLWVAYLCADWIATVALGCLSSQQGDDPGNKNNTLKALWAPILLLHLGGPDTITAYAIEDNALWLRHLLGLVVQVSVAFYVFIKSLRLSQLNYVAIPMFITGVIKYGERTWALRSASINHFRDSLLPSPDPGPNYAKFMEEYDLREIEGYNIQCSKLADPNVVIRSLVGEEEDCRIKDASLPKRGYAYLQTYKRLFADLILGFQELELSKSYFLNSGWEDAFSVIELELAFVFDSFFTKAAILYSRTGHILRAITVFSTLVTLAGFYFSHKNEYSRVDVVITYLLLVGAYALEIFGILVWLCSDWSLIWLDRQERIPVKKLYQALSWLKMINPGRKWSNTIVQYNLISSCFNGHESKTKICNFLTRVIQSESTEIVGDFLKEFIFKELLQHTSVSREDNSFCKGRGSATLDKYQFEELRWSIEKEFDQSLLLWHIATDLCYSVDGDSDPQSVQYINCQVSKLLSNYMMYLLVKCPFMLPKGIGKIRFQDTWAEAKDFSQERSIMDAESARKRLIKIRTDILPDDVKGDRSKSVLFDACRVAKYLEQKRYGKWEIISGVWVEMLVYAASQCRSDQHAQQLAQGGELLTHVWLLLAHLGLSEHFQISEGHARVVLDVK